jgi:hypothetical protein
MQPVVVTVETPTVDPHPRASRAVAAHLLDAAGRPERMNVALPLGDDYLRERPSPGGSGFATTV